MEDNSQNSTTAFHILLTGNFVSKLLLVLSLLGRKISFQLKLTKKHWYDARICDIY